MAEATYRLPPEVYLETDKFTRLEIGRISIAGFVDFEEYEETVNFDLWPYPVFFLDGELASETVRSQDGEVRRYWRLSSQVLTNKVNDLSIISVPDDKSKNPWVHFGNANWPTTTYAYLFEPPLPYSQEQFSHTIRETRLTYPEPTPGP